MKEKNKVYLMVQQTIPAHTNKSGELIAEFSNFVEFTSETTQEVSAENFALLDDC